MLNVDIDFSDAIILLNAYHGIKLLMKINQCTEWKEIIIIKKVNSCDSPNAHFIRKATD